MPRRPDSCRIHRPALVDFVEGHARGPDSPTALDHLARCRRCERDMTEVAQTVVALRRLAARARSADAPVDGWITLRERLERSQRAADDAARRLRRALSGAFAAIAIVALMAIPGLSGAATSRSDDGLAVVPESLTAATRIVRRYDPNAQRLTEGIVLAIAGSGRSRASPPDLTVGRPRSTDRQDRPRAFPGAPTKPAPAAPRTALRT